MTRNLNDEGRLPTLKNKPRHSHENGSPESFIPKLYRALDSRLRGNDEGDGERRK